MVANCYFVLAALLIGGSSAHAAPGHRRPAVNAKLPSDADADAAADTQKKVADAEEQPAPEDTGDARPATAPSGWSFAIGPYVWASAVQLDVSFGPLMTGTEIGFVTLARHGRYGADAQMEARHGRFAITGDILYGAADISGSTEIASVMTSISGNAVTLLVDSAVSYAVLGSDAGPYALEARSGVRYQRNAIQGEVGVAGFTVQTPEIVDSGTDVVLGARGAMRPTPWLQLAGAFDVGVVGASDSTWSATLDASLRVASWAQVSAGWRTLSMRRTSVNIQLSGPRVALQLLF
jgi:hypothetical protein